MKNELIIEYDDGKDVQGLQRDIPTMTVCYHSIINEEFATLNTIKGTKAITLYECLVNSK